MRSLKLVTAALAAHYLAVFAANHAPDHPSYYLTILLTCHVLGGFISVGKLSSRSVLIGLLLFGADILSVAVGVFAGSAVIFAATYFFGTDFLVGGDGRLIVQSVSELMFLLIFVPLVVAGGKVLQIQNGLASPRDFA